MSKRYQKGQKFGVPASSVAGQTMHLVGSEAADTVRLNTMGDVIWLRLGQTMHLVGSEVHS